MPRRSVILLAFILMVVQSACLGPTSFLPNYLIILTLGNFLVGLNLSLAMIPILSELIEILSATKLYEPSQISDMTAALFNSMFNLGNLLAPVIASAINDAWGYK
jgi:MFS family permease